MSLIRKIAIRTVSILIILILTVGVLEGGLRLTSVVGGQIRSWRGVNARPIDLSVPNDYQMRDPRHPQNYILKPGFSLTLQQAIEDKERTGRFLAVQYLKERAAKLHIQPDEIICRINQAGFKGPELDQAHAHFRILTIGDSCTFGTLFDKYSYPRVLERHLRSGGVETEVINGGVEGYGVNNVLLRIEDFKALRPQITTIYLGWNDLYSNEPLIGLERYSEAYRLAKKAYQGILYRSTNPQQAAEREYRKAKHVDPSDPEINLLDNYTPPFLTELIEIIKQMQSVGSKVVLVTLPGLLIMDQPPSAEALKIGHLPGYTNNPYVLAKMTERYNIALREIAKQYRLQVIDLENWSKTALVPRDAYFFDSIHLYEEGQEMIGTYMAQEIYRSTWEQSGTMEN